MDIAITLSRNTHTTQVRDHWCDVPWMEVSPPSYTLCV